MFCGQCGTKNYEGDLFCESCGTRFASPRNDRSVAREDRPKNDIPMARQDSPRNNIFSEGQDHPRRSQPKKQDYTFSKKIVAIVLAFTLALGCIYFVAASGNSPVDDEQAIMNLLERHITAMIVMDFEAVISHYDPTSRTSDFLGIAYDFVDGVVSDTLREDMGFLSNVTDFFGIDTGLNMIPSLMNFLIDSDIEVHDDFITREEIDELVAYVLSIAEIVDFNNNRTTATIRLGDDWYFDVVKIEGEWYFSAW